MARFPNDEYQSLLANAVVADTAAGDSDVPESTGGAEPVGAAAQSPATYGTRSIDLVTDTKVVDPEPDVPTTWWSKMMALGFGILVWLGLANPPTTGLEKPDLSGPAPEVAPLSHKPTKYKILALVCSCLLSIGSHYASQMLSGLQSTLLEELNISYTQYSLLQAAVSLVNTIVPLFGGQFIDMFGTGWGSVVASSLILVGDMIVAISTEISSYPVMVIGRLIYGIGSGSIVTVQEAILAHWFHGRGLAITIGLQISLSRLSALLATGTVNEIAESTGFYGNAFWVSTSMCAFSWLINLMYVFLLRHVGEADTTEKIRKRLRQKNLFKPSVLMRFPLSFWIIIFLSLVFGASWGPFTHITTGLIMDRFCDDAVAAAWQASVALAVPVVGSPLIGLFCDKFGQRPLVAVTAAVTLVLSFTLLGFTYISPAVSLTFYSISLTIGPIALISSVPHILPLTAVGTALGMYKCAINIGATIMDPIVGFIIDIYNNYYEALVVYLVFGTVAVVGTLVFWRMDFTHFDGILTANEKKRREVEKSRMANLQQIFDETLLRKIPKFNYVAVGTFLMLMLFSWALYIALVVYSNNLESEPSAVLYAAGAFANAGTAAAAAIARWDGDAWSALAAGVNGTVYAAAAFRDRLYVGGDFAMINGTAANLAVWDGAAWTSTAAAADVATGPVYALAVFQDRLVVGGGFTDAIGTWNSTHWASVANTLTGSVRALAAAATDMLYVGGEFAGPFAWDGITWTMLGSGLNGDVYALTIHTDGALYAGGAFAAGTANPSRWTGWAWQAVDGTASAGTDGTIYALTNTDDGRLCAGGAFASVAGVIARNVACWDGAAWAARGDGRDAAVRSLLYYDKALVVGGDFAGGVASVRQCGAGPNTWQSYENGVDGPVYILFSSSSSWGA